MEANKPYYERRLRQELAAVEQAKCVKAAAAHRDLAGIYKSLIDAEDASPNVVVLVPEVTIERRTGLQVR